MRLTRHVFKTLTTLSKLTTPVRRPHKAVIRLTPWHAMKKAILASLLACTVCHSVKAQAINNAKILPSAKATQSWQGNFTGHNNEVLTLKGTNLYLTASTEDTPILIGSVSQFLLGSEGLLVFNVDNNPAKRLSLVLFDVALNSWYRGTVQANSIDWEPVAKRQGQLTAFQVGDGSILYPLEQIQTAERTSSYAQAVSANSLAPLTYPVQGSQYTRLAASQHVWTTFLILADGTVVATTRVKEDTLFGGFHAQGAIALYPTTNTSPTYLTSVPSPIIGCTGTIFGHSDVSVSWTGQIAPGSLPFVHYYAVVATWEPNWFTTVNDASKFAALAATVIQPLISAGK